MPLRWPSAGAILNMVKVNRQVISYLRQNWLGHVGIFLDLLNQSNSLIMRLQNRDEVDDAFWQTTAVECEPDPSDRGWQLATDVVLHDRNRECQRHNGQNIPGRVARSRVRHQRSKPPGKQL